MITILRHFDKASSSGRVIALMFFLVGVGGCSDSTSTDSEKPDRARNDSSPSSQSLDPLLAARQFLRGGDFQSASTTIDRYLVEHPGDLDAVLIAAQVEAALGRPESAIEIAQTIPIDNHRLGERAARLCIEQAIKVGDDLALEQMLGRLIEHSPQQVEWRRNLIAVLNRQGRRREACQHAELLCRRGLAGDAELLCLIRRADAFPPKLPEGKDPQSVFAAGLGMARWHFTAQEYEQGLHQIRSDLDKPGAHRAAAIALQGRMLIEFQSYQRMPDWLASCDQEVKEYGDYWAALGLWLVHSEENEAAARAFLEAIRRNPTDRVCFQRLAQVLDALGKREDADQFRLRGVAIAKTETLLEQFTKTSNPQFRQSLSQALLELGRPFEALAWATLALPRSADRQRQDFDAKRQSLLADKGVERMVIDHALSGVDPSQFTIDPDMLQKLSEASTGNSNVMAVLPRLESAEMFATPELNDSAPRVGADFQWYNGPVIDVSTLPIYQSLGGGIAVIDFDLDGWPDLYFAQGSGVPPAQPGARSNQLLRNVDGTFLDVTEQSESSEYGYAAGLAAGDLNQDGFPDLVVGNLGDNRLFLNNGDGSFTDATDRLGIHQARFTSSLAIADITGDALPELFETNYIEMEGAFDPPKVLADGSLQQPSPLLHYADSDRWFRSLGDGSFEVIEIDESVAKPGSSLGVIVADFDRNGRNEIFVGNDARPNHFLIYEGEHRFRNEADLRGLANGFRGSATGCMGIASGDFNRDGTLDLQIANYADEAANLYLQTAGGSFVDSAIKYGIATTTQPYVAFGTKALDLDRNGWLDFITTNGHIFDKRESGALFKMPPQVFMGSGRDYQMIEVDQLSDYFRGSYLGRTITMLDFDRDGAIDFVVGHLEEPTALLRNETKTPGRWLQLELVGTTSERDAIGAVIEVKTLENHVFHQWVTAGDGYFASDEPVIDIGLGKTTGIEQVTVHWPSGHRQSFDKIRLDRRYLLVEDERQAIERSLPLKENPVQ